MLSMGSGRAWRKRDDGRTGTECGLLRAVGRKEVILSEYSQACCLQLSVSMSLGTEAWAPALPLSVPPYTEQKPQYTRNNHPPGADCPTVPPTSPSHGGRPDKSSLITLCGVISDSLAKVALYMEPDTLMPIIIQDDTPQTCL